MWELSEIYFVAASGSAVISIKTSKERDARCGGIRFNVF